ncbi:MAG: 16S rRNA (cytosine(1402)-N(4))-methyltransferase RsmH [Bdellovibrionaceae bacterium]|nr:16S rRNA (cytosine(1402)-N(4))-methyltransferase RsmH [Pseudobdellovibrionaceae bacterium]MBX3032565.1 16S rRNA (cytosine(1402)-N(4))-methyltransferase RsmH [Pseudobdellovibrionaceae bacterium]
MENAEVLTKVLQSVSFDPGHEPVMPVEILEAFLPLKGRSPLRTFDGTFGRGGHFKLLMALFGQDVREAVVMDQDMTAVEHARRDFQTEVEAGRLKVVHGNFSEFSEHVQGPFDIMMLDLGVSSPQLDTADRGFSFYHDGPLDMRMNQQQELTAEIILNTASEDELNNLFRELGEVRRPFRVTRAVVHDRKTKAFKTTRELAGLIERVDGWRHKGVHPATQYFMALRLAVNDELGVLRTTLPAMMAALSPGGRLAVLTFHSLEDRIVKNIFKQPDVDGRAVHKKVIVPTQEECKRNSRSRSAKLRIFQRGVQDEPGHRSSP